MRWGGACVLIFACSDAAAAGRAIFKCTMPNGETTFSASPCVTAPGATELQPHSGGQVHAPPADKASSEAAAAKKAAASAPDCSTWMPPEGTVTVAQPAKPDRDQLPRDASGKPVDIFVSKRGPMSVAAGCSALVSTCSQRSDDPRVSIDACFQSAPRCQSAQPWQEDQACCPQACWDKFADLRRQCVDASSASYRALFQEHCVAGEYEAAPAPKPR